MAGSAPRGPSSRGRPSDPQPPSAQRAPLCSAAAACTSPSCGDKTWLPPAVIRACGLQRSQRRVFISTSVATPAEARGGFLHPPTRLCVPADAAGAHACVPAAKSLAEARGCRGTPEVWPSVDSLSPPDPCSGREPRPPVRPALPGSGRGQAWRSSLTSRAPVSPGPNVPEPPPTRGCPPRVPPPPSRGAFSAPGPGLAWLAPRAR